MFFSGSQNYALIVVPFGFIYGGYSQISSEYLGGVLLVFLLVYGSSLASFCPFFFV